MRKERGHIKKKLLRGFALNIGNQLQYIKLLSHLIYFRTITFVQQTTIHFSYARQMNHYSAYINKELERKKC